MTMTRKEHDYAGGQITEPDVPTRCADGSLNWHGLDALDYRRAALDARRRARIYAAAPGRVDRTQAGEARYYWHKFKMHLRRARELAS
jgi:hypothetical protein